MTLLLSDVVLGGELIATEHYSVRGFLYLLGSDRPLLLHLTGNPSTELMGKHLCFEASFNPRHSEESEPQDLPNLAWQQIGPTGTISTVPQFDGENKKSKKRILHIEWFGQNGRVVVELANPILEFTELDERDDLLDTLLDDNSEYDDAETNDDPSVSFGAEVDSSDGQNDNAVDWNEEEEEEDPYRLLSDDLKQHFDELARETDRFIDPDDTLSELELFDELLESGEGELIGQIFESPLHLPRPDELNASTVEPVLKRLLAELAKFGITLDFCEHYSPLDAYRLLVEEICREEHTYPELRDTQWVQHFTTTEFCEQCAAEIEAELAEHEQCAEDLRDDPLLGDEGRSDDDVPF